MGDPIAVIEAAYSLTGDEGAWLGQLGETVRRNTADGPWLVMRTFEARSAWVNRSMACVGADEAAVWASYLDLFGPLNDGNYEPRMFHQDFIYTLRQFPAVLLRRGFSESHVRAFEAHLATWLRKWHVADELIVNAQDPSRIGCVLAVPMRRQGPLSPGEAHRWGCLAAHFATAFRIRRQLEGTAVPMDRQPTSEAVLDPDGRLQHAELPAQSHRARSALRQAVQALDRARGSLRRENPEDAVAYWQALVAGRWSLLDHFDSDGRRFVVAHRNDPSAPDSRGLTLRERQVLAYEALGHSNKVIAYELGLSLSSVSTHLARGRAKLRTQLGAVLPSRVPGNSTGRC